MSKVRVCFLGTPEFAVVSLGRLLADDHYEIVGVVTQPDRPSGRKLQLTPSPVKVLAEKHGLPVITPESLRKDAAAVETILSWKAEVAVVVAFGQILTQSFLDSFRYGCVNVHGSILPRWRGAAPIQRAIEAGDAETGVTLQKMVKQLDAGDIIGIRRVPLNDTITALELHDQLADLGADLLHVELMDYVRGNLAPIPQDESLVTMAPKIDKTESLIDWNLSASLISGKARGFLYGPGTFTLHKGKKLKLHRVRANGDLKGTPGKVLSISADHFTVGCGEGALEIYELQPESKSKMMAKDFLTGYQLQTGEQLGV